MARVRLVAHRVSALYYGKHDPQKSAAIVKRVIGFNKTFILRRVGMPEDSSLHQWFFRRT
jgi:hypothetical protein